MSTTAVPASTESFAATLDSGQRCQSTSADGRRCTMRRWEAHPTLCVPHARAEAEARTSHQQIPSRPSCFNDSDDELDEAFDFTPPSGEFHTATDVNRALGKIFILLAQNRIPRRKAVALGYLGQLLLQTLPAVREEINDCLGYKAWTETLESAFYEDEPEEEPTHSEAKNETNLDAQNEVSNEVRNVGPGFSPAASPLATPISALPEATEPTGVGSAQTEVCAIFRDEQPPVAQTLVCGSCSPEPDGTAPAEPEAANPPTETAPETRLRRLTYDPWHPPLVYAGPYKSYFDEPEVKAEFLRKYGRPIEEANIPPSRLNRALTPVTP